ncbi:hypothetical protein DEIPH_ctg016orf0018 [Deinococcus phoenicis]|uniref:Resolvase/invertase-type recombinase catalytic domain-containing protein n=1 Tax=Deinococcus phoenicis TaxID=1476583 RepID=A0A016QSA2_9DEIO|nr:recombinase family protein [Deinococcus phoenicis]EYB68871.1 hypothetical protein DEIPH_ctg016orf0018 [Deinococcus phoenicis]
MNLELFAETYAVYTRVSTGGQEDNTSPEGQYEACKRYGETQGWKLMENGWYHDTISGTKKGIDRKMLAELYDLIEAKTIKHVVFKRVDRVGREAAIIKEIIKMVYSLGGKVSIADKGRTYKNFRECNNDIRFESVVAEIERDNIVEKNWEGRISQFKKGSALGKQPYGYITAFDDSKSRKFRLVKIVTSEAEALMDFLKKFVETRSIKEAVDYAASKGYKTRSGHPFAHHFFRDTLKNLELYNGKPVKQEYSFFEEVFSREFVYPQIISDELYYQIREATRLKSKADREYFDGVRPYLGIVFCSHCGSRAGIRYKSKATPKKNGEVYSSFIVFCPSHAKEVQKTYRLEGKGSGKECGKSFRYGEITKSILQFLDDASRLGTAEQYSKELLRVLIALRDIQFQIKKAVALRDNASNRKDSILKKLDKLMELEGVDISSFIAANSENLKSIEEQIRQSNSHISELKRNYNSVTEILEMSGLKVTEELLSSIEVNRRSIAKEESYSGDDVRNRRNKIEERLLLDILPETVKSLANELSEGLGKIRGLVEMEEWETVNTLLYRLGIRVYVNFNEPLRNGKLPEIALAVALAESADRVGAVAGLLAERTPETVCGQNTTKGHALKNIPMLREALNARGVPVQTPDAGEEGRLL